MTGMEDVLAAHSGHAFGREEADESRWFDKCECGHLLFGTDYSPEHKMRPGKSYANAAFAAHVAEALTAAGYRKPRTIESDDQLREMKAIGTLLRDGKGRVVERVETLPGHLRWYWLSNNTVNSVWPILPATVLWEPLP